MGEKPRRSWRKLWDKFGHLQEGSSKSPFCTWQPHKFHAAESGEEHMAWWQRPDKIDKQTKTDKTARGFQCHKTCQASDARFSAMAGFWGGNKMGEVDSRAGDIVWELSIHLLCNWLMIDSIPVNACGLLSTTRSDLSAQSQEWASLCCNFYSVNGEEWGELRKPSRFIDTHLIFSIISKYVQVLWTWQVFNKWQLPKSFFSLILQLSFSTV